MRKNNSFVTGVYEAPSCEIAELNPKAHYLQATSPYGESGAAGGILGPDNTNDYSGDEFLL